MCVFSVSDLMCGPESCFVDFKDSFNDSGRSDARAEYVLFVGNVIRLCQSLNCLNVTDKHRE
jgi:hypothetical protein